MRAWGRKREPPPGPDWLVILSDEQGKKYDETTKLPAVWLAQFGLAHNKIVRFEGMRLERG